MTDEQFEAAIHAVHATLPADITGQQIVDLLAVLAVTYGQSPAEIKLMMELATNKAVMVTETRAAVQHLFEGKKHD